MAKKGNVTLKMIAEKAGVSVSSVTRYINHNGYVSQKKREKIQQVMDELHYIPNFQAKFLRSGRSKLFGHIYAASNENFFFTKLAIAIEKESSVKGYKVISYALNENDISMFNSTLQDMLSYGVDGIIVNLGMNNKQITEEMGEIIQDIAVPIIMVERPANIFGIDKVLIDNVEGSYSAVYALNKHGYDKIAYIGVEQDDDVERERYKGYIDAMKSINFEFAQQNSYFSDKYTIENGYKKCMELLKKVKDNNIAIFAASDILAAGVYEAIRESGMRIPADISVVGYDDTIAKFLSPALSTVSLPVDEIAEMIVESLMDKIQERYHNIGNRTIKIGPVYVERDSVKTL